jgi:hypothetical protein
MVVSDHLHVHRRGIHWARRMIASRRSFLFGGAILLSAPAIVRVAELMPVSVPKYDARYDGRRWLPYDVVSATQTTMEPLTLDNIRRIKAVLAFQPVDYIMPVPLSWEKAIFRGRLS